MMEKQAAKEAASKELAAAEKTAESDQNTDSDAAKQQEAPPPKTAEEIEEEKRLCRYVRELSKKRVDGEESTKAYVANIDFLSLGELKSFFGCIGPVVGVLRMSHSYRLEFANPTDASIALKLNGTEPFGKPIIVSRTVPPAPAPKPPPVLGTVDGALPGAAAALAPAVGGVLQPAPPPPPGYICERCNLPGHYSQSCPQQLQAQAAALAVGQSNFGNIGLGAVALAGAVAQNPVEELTRTVVIQNVSPAVAQDQLAKFLSSCGDVLFSRLSKSVMSTAAATGPVGQIATVEFTTQAAAQKALSTLNGVEYVGRKLTVSQPSQPIIKTPDELIRLGQFQKMQRNGNPSGSAPEAATSTSSTAAKPTTKADGVPLSSSTTGTAVPASAGSATTPVLTGHLTQQQPATQPAAFSPLQLQAHQLPAARGLGFVPGVLGSAPVTQASIARSLLGGDSDSDDGRRSRHRKSKKKRDRRRDRHRHSSTSSRHKSRHSRERRRDRSRSRDRSRRHDRDRRDRSRGRDRDRDDGRSRRHRRRHRSRRSRRSRSESRSHSRSGSRSPSASADSDGSREPDSAQKTNKERDDASTALSTKNLEEETTTEQ